MSDERAHELMAYVESGRTVPDAERRLLCTPEVFEIVANTMPDRWLKTRLVAGTCGLTGSRVQPWVLLPTQKTSAAWLIAYMNSGTALFDVLKRALQLRRPAQDPQGWKSLCADLVAQPEQLEGVRKFVDCDSILAKKLNRKQLQHIPPARLAIMNAGIEKLKKRLRHVLWRIDTQSRSESKSESESESESESKDRAKLQSPIERGPTPNPTLISKLKSKYFVILVIVVCIISAVVTFIVITHKRARAPQHVNLRGVPM
jgi:hypothetical protein